MKPALLLLLFFVLYACKSNTDSDLEKKTSRLNETTRLLNENGEAVENARNDLHTSKIEGRFPEAERRMKELLRVGDSLRNSAILQMKEIKIPGFNVKE